MAYKTTIYFLNSDNYFNDCFSFLRDSNKSNVLAHVKGHYGKKNEKPIQLKISESNADDTGAANAESEISKEGISSHDSNASSRVLTKTPSYKCGHCQQVSNWKHVIQVSR